MYLYKLMCWNLLLCLTIGCPTETEQTKNEIPKESPSPNSPDTVKTDAGTAASTKVDAGTTVSMEVDAGTTEPTELDAGTTQTPLVDAGTIETLEGDAGHPSCPTGTTGDGINCTDINECNTNNGGCGDPTYTACSNNIGAEPTCSDIDECADEFGGCGDPDYSLNTNAWCTSDNEQCIHENYYTCTNNVGGPATCGTIPENITNKVFTSRETQCTAYIGTYFAVSLDVNDNTIFYSDVEIADNGNTCTITSDAVPNHDFNDGNGFANATAEVVESYDIVKNPTAANATTALTLQWDNAIFLNGAKLDLLPAACYGVGNAPLGEEKFGCFDMSIPWRYDPMFAGNDFDTDSHNAHTQPDGAYHYHGDPASMYDPSGNTASGVIGFAADGFPIFGPFIDDNGFIREVQSSYVLKSGNRESQVNEGAFPGGTYDGTFIDDYEFNGSGDLDECNGMVNGNGEYAYYVTYTYPWVMRCFKGTPNMSFQKSPP